MSQALRPVLRQSTISSIPSSSTSTTYICQACRNARLLKRPKRPYMFTQLVTLSDGSAFTMRTTSPHPVYRSSRDTRNAPLWNPSSKELLNVEEDEAGRLAGFRARFGLSFDASNATGAQALQDSDKSAGDDKADAKKGKGEEAQDSEEDDGSDEDETLLQMISSFGKVDKGNAAQIARKKM